MPLNSTNPALFIIIIINIFFIFFLFLLLTPLSYSHLLKAAFEDKEEQYLSAGDAYLLVYSVTDRRSFKKANELRFKLQRSKETETVPIILVGNKTDLERSREVSFAGKGCYGYWRGKIK